MSKLELESITNWMYRNARALDLNIWKCLFLNGNAEDVANSLLYYQNEDGGFGNALDPDNWNSNSVPYACVYAIETLNLVHYFDMCHPVYKGIKRYLENSSMEQWVFTLPSNEDHPHAAFYNYSEAYNDVQSLGIKIFLSAFVLAHMENTAIHESVLAHLDSFIHKIFENDLGDMGPSSYITLVDTMQRVNISGYNYDDLQNRLKAIVNEQMQKDEAMWNSYGYRPSDFIKSSSSIFLTGNEAIVEKECDYLIRTIPQNDIWPVSWCWFENAQKYPKEEIISLHIAKARKCIERVIFLKEFDRVKFGT